jgi:hypothetical protein
MSDSELKTPGGALPETPENRLDEDDRLKPAFVREVMDRVEAATSKARTRSSSRSTLPTLPTCSSWSTPTTGACWPRALPICWTATSSQR